MNAMPMMVTMTPFAYMNMYATRKKKYSQRVVGINCFQSSGSQEIVTVRVMKSERARRMAA
jgi:hypothetical protein